MRVGRRVARQGRARQGSRSSAHPGRRCRPRRSSTQRGGSLPRLPSGSHDPPPGRAPQVVVAEAAPRYDGHRMARKLADAGVQTTLIADSAVFAMMARVNKARGRARAGSAADAVLSPALPCRLRWRGRGAMRSRSMAHPSTKLSPPSPSLQRAGPRWRARGPRQRRRHRALGGAHGRARGAAPLGAARRAGGPAQAQPAVPPRPRRHLQRRAARG